MGVLQRVGDILSANIHDLVDRFEDPEKMLRQAIREMEALVQETMDGAAKSIATEKLLLKDLASEEHLAKQWEDKAERAVQAGDDPAARKALSRRMEHERLAKSLRKELVEAEKATKALRAQIDDMQAKLTEARRKTATLAARKKAASVRKHLSAAPLGKKRTAFAKFEQMRERIERQEEEAKALAELHAGALEGLTQEKDEIEADALVEEELSRLKARAKNQHAVP